MKEDNQFLVITHLSQLIYLVTGFGGLIVPLILWQVNKDKVYQMDEHGKSIINFQINLILWSVICVPLILFCGLGFIGFLVLGILAIVFPIVNAIKASRGETPTYPLTINIIS